MQQLTKSTNTLKKKNHLKTSSIDNKSNIVKRIKKSKYNKKQIDFKSHTLGSIGIQLQYVLYA